MAIEPQAQEVETMRRSSPLSRFSYLIAPLLFSLLVAPLKAQRQVRDPLTPAQAEEIAKAGIDPNERVHLYTRYLEEHADTIKDLAKRAETPARDNLIANDLEDLADLMDELGSNLDVYSDRKSDIRKTLKPLNDAIQHWQAILNGLPSEPGIDVARTDALDSSNDLVDQAKQMLQDQDQYFKNHKDQAGQDWHMPGAASSAEH
jgi:Mg2+ and Co2+ transporter CorA